MIRISGIPVLNLFKTGTSFMAARDRRAQRTDTRSGKGRFSEVPRDGGPLGSDPDSIDARNLPPVSGPAVPRLRDNADAVRPADAAAGAKAEGEAWRRSRFPSIAIAGLSATVTAAVMAGISWPTDSGTRIGASILALLAMTVTFLTGRVVLAPSRAAKRDGSASAVAGSGNPEVDDHSPRPRGKKSALGASSSGAPAPVRRLIGRSEAHPSTDAADVRSMRVGAGAVERFRRHVRIRPRHRAVTVVTEQGARYDAEVIDLSQSGVALEGTMPGVWIGSMVTVGSRRAKAVRMLPQGMALEFSVPIPAKALHVNTVL